MLSSTIFLFGIGLTAAAFLALASRVFYVYEDPKIMQVEDALLGANCGGCGYPGCSSAAEAVVKGEEGADICVAGGADIALAVAALMGLEVEIKEPEIAYTSCRYNLLHADTKFNYSGVSDCRAAAQYSSGPKECPIGCIGLGTCSKSCPFGAISMKDDLPVFDKNKCTACGVCVEVCPKDIIYLTSITNRMLGDYKTDECTTPCQRACPTGIDIPGYIREISQGNYAEALRIIKEKNPLPGIISRICPAPCEMDCRRNYVDDSVAINHLKRFATEHEMKTGKRIHPYSNLKTDLKVAVIGAGAQGLTTAYYLACYGHEPTIFESTGELGGIINKVIPESRLPRDIMKWDFDGIIDAGVSVETGKTFGVDITVGSLLADGYKAIVISTGGIDSRQLMFDKISDTGSIPGIYMLLDFLKKNSSNEKIEIGKNVYIVGGGNSTISAAIESKKQGAENITIVYPFDRDDLLSRKVDVQKAESEGINFKFNTEMTGFTGEKSKLTGVTFLENDYEDLFAADTLIVATGRLSDIVITRPYERNKNDELEEITDGRWVAIKSNKMFPSINNIFNLNLDNGIANDNVAVIKSIGKGRRIARAVHLQIKQKNVKPQDKIILDNSSILNTINIRNVEIEKRNIKPSRMTVTSYSNNDVFFNKSEIEKGYSEEVAVVESKRCLDCGLICYKKSAS